MVTYPSGEPQEVCALCGSAFERIDPEFASRYANLVCSDCDDQAVTGDGSPATGTNQYDGGPNPVFVDGERCWRRYRFGGHVTRLDEHECDSLDEFYETHREDG